MEYLCLYNVLLLNELCFAIIRVVHVFGKVRSVFDMLFKSSIENNI